MKTISELNNRWWYRFVKVLFLLFFLLILGIVNILIFSERDIKELSLNETKISCTYGSKKVFTPHKNNDFFLVLPKSSDFPNGRFDYKHFFSNADEYDIKNILNECYSPNRTNYDIFLEQKMFEVQGDERLKIPKADRPLLSEDERQYLDQELQKMENSSRSEKIKYLDFRVQLFDIDPEFSYLPFIRTLLLSNIIIFFIFEVMRRAFYYIALGKLRPKKE